MKIENTYSESVLAQITNALLTSAMFAIGAAFIAVLFCAAIYNTSGRSRAETALEQAEAWETKQLQKIVLADHTHIDANGDEWTFSTTWKGWHVTITTTVNGNESTVCPKHIKAWSTPQVAKDHAQFIANIKAMLARQNA